MDDGFVAVDGLRVYARRVAPPAGSKAVADVVVVHGAVVSSRYLVPLMHELASDFRVHALDLPGYGRSDHPPAAPDVAGLADALTAWVRVSGLEGALVVANSFGCQIVARAWAGHPGLFDRAVLQAPTYDSRARTMRATIARWLQTAPREPRGLGRIYARDLLDCGPRRALATYRAGLEHPIEEDLARISGPVLVVRGDGDVVVPQRFAEELAGALPSARLVVLPGTAHALPYSAPAELAAVTRAFFEAPARRPPPSPRAVP